MNKQITEDFVSFETAKLLKEKGFDEPCSQTYAQHPAYEEPIVMINDASTNSKGVFGAVFPCYASAPTHQMALKWLREVHKMYIYIKPLEDGNCFSAHLLYNGIDKLIEGGAWGSYESACEAALLYVLKKIDLI